MVVKVGEKAPDFESVAWSSGGVKKIGLKDFKGKWVVLFFYPRDFTFVCPTEIRGFAAKERQFNELNAYVVGASTDSEHSHKAWFERDLKEVRFPILADTSHRVSRDYEVLIDSSGEALRGTFIIDPNGVLQYQVVSNLNTGRSIEETLRVVNALQTGELCPVDWKPGTETLSKKRK